MDTYKAAKKLKNRCMRSRCKACPAHRERKCVMRDYPYAYNIEQEGLGTSQYGKKKTRKKMLKALYEMQQACYATPCDECRFWNRARATCRIDRPYKGAEKVHKTE